MLARSKKTLQKKKVQRSFTWGKKTSCRTSSGTSGKASSRCRVGCFCKKGSWRCQGKGKLRRVLYIGQKKRPKSLIVLLHGMGDDATGNVDWAKVWTQKFPGSLVAIPQAPCVHFVYKPEDKELGFDWLPQRGTHDISDKEANVRALQRITERRLQQLDAWLTRVLRRLNLRSENVILTGFSQGCILAAILGARRRVKAVALAGGVGTEPVFTAERNDYFGPECWARWEELLPQRKRDEEEEAPKTKFLICCGGADHTVPRKRVAAMLSDYKVSWKVVDGMVHLFPTYWRGQMLAWMKNAWAS